MRNTNYFKSIVMEFFPKDADKFRDSVLALEAANGQGH